MELRGLETFGDASPDLIYCAEALTYAFPDARIVQVVRDGRDVAASMLADPVVMSWFRPSFVNVDTEFPNPFFGIDIRRATASCWPRPVAGWRGARCAGAGPCAWPPGCTAACQAGQLKTIRYEDLLGKPDEALAELSRFAGTTVPAAEIRNEARASRHAQPQPPRARPTRRPSRTEDAAEIDKLAGEELRRLGYTPRCS